MIAKDLKNEIAASVIPVLLGNGRRSPLLALRLYLTLGTVSLHLGAHRRLSDLVGIFSLFRSTATDERLLSEQLLDIFEEFDGYLLLLVPTDKPSRAFVEAKRDALASRFIIAEPDEVLSHLPHFSNCNS